MSFSSLTIGVFFKIAINLYFSIILYTSHTAWMFLTILISGRYLFNFFCHKKWLKLTFYHLQCSKPLSFLLICLICSVIDYPSQRLLSSDRVKHIFLVYVFCLFVVFLKIINIILICILFCFVVAVIVFPPSNISSAWRVIRGS